MTENNAAQPGLTDEEILDAIKAGIRAARDEGLAYAGPDNYVVAGAHALLSKLRAEGVQAGDERAAFEAAMLKRCQNVERWPGPHGGYLDSHTGLAWRAWNDRAALAISPAAAELPRLRPPMCRISGVSEGVLRRAAMRHRAMEELQDPSALAALADGLESIAGNENAELAAAYFRREADRMASAPVAGETQEATKAAYERGRKKGNEEARSWPEDFAHENGRYMCKCHRCDQIFHGHKRRVTCKVCHAAPQASEADDLIGALGQCRDAFPIPATAGSPLDLLWQEAMSDPAAVPAYVKACASNGHASEAVPVGYLQPERRMPVFQMQKDFITAKDFGGDVSALVSWAKSSNAIPLYTKLQADKDGECKSCNGMGFMDGVGDRCPACNGDGGDCAKGAGGE